MTHGLRLLSFSVILSAVGCTSPGKYIPPKSQPIAVPLPSATAPTSSNPTRPATNAKALPPATATKVTPFAESAPPPIIPAAPTPVATVAPSAVKAPDMSLPALPPAESLKPGNTPSPVVSPPGIVPPSFNDMNVERPKLPE